jgi:hypothetical protein
MIMCKVDTSDVDMVARFREYFGGTFYAMKARKKNWKNIFRWRLVGDKAFNALKLMVPYMCIRRREKFYGLAKPSGYGNEDWGSYLQKQTRIQEINVGCTKTPRSEDGSGRD